jgi:lipoic acid synthetase
MPYPRWLKKPLPKSAAVRRLRPYLGDLSTVCESALCPNRGECFVRQTVTFLLLGNSCTRRCSFCAVAKAPPEPVDENEPEKVAQAAARLGLKHIVLTSVTRDDLPDGGAAHFARTVLAVQKLLPRATVEVLTPDFQGDFSALDTVLAARPAVYNHNIETVPRLYPEIRPQADYVRSLRLLAGAAQKTLAKSGLMLGLGETETELKSALKDLKNAGTG